MGLKEKRALAAFQKDRYPNLVREVNAAAGKELEFEVAWAELNKDGWSESFDAGMTYNFFAPLRKAFEAICIDDIGKDAVKTSIRAVKIGSQRNWSSLEVGFEDGVVKLDADPSYNREESCVDDNTQRILAVLEPAL
jgi:hypothetical protein